MCPLCRRPVFYMLLFILFSIFIVPEAFAEESSEKESSNEERLSAILLPSDSGYGQQLAVQWTGDSSAQLSVWHDTDPGDRDAREQPLLERVPIDEGIQLFPLQQPLYAEPVDGVPLRFQLFQDGEAPRTLRLSVDRLDLAASPRTIDSIERVPEKAIGTCTVMDGFHTKGPSHRVRASMVYDDGTGPALYVGGDFRTVGSVVAPGVAKWDGTTWSPLPGSPGSVYALEIYDYGSGPRLIAGGAGVGQWDGSAWSALSGLPRFEETVRAMKVFDDGQGPVLVIGTGDEFTLSAQSPAIVQWDGATGIAASLGDVEDSVFALEVYDDGSGPVLVAGGTFTSIDGVTARHVARWDGASWSSFPSDPGGIGVRALAVYARDDGKPRLVAGGYFLLREWTGTSWAFNTPSALVNDDLDLRTVDDVYALTVYHDGDDQVLVAAGYDFTRESGEVMRWNGRWSMFSPDPYGDSAGPWDDAIATVAAFDDGSGRVVAGGHFTIAAGGSANNLAVWDGTSWAPTVAGDPRGIFDGSLSTFAVFDDGSGPMLVAGGQFRSAGGVSAKNIAAWDGTTWSPLGAGLGDHDTDRVDALTVHQSASGPRLIAGGRFSMAGGISANHIAQWDGTSWAPIGSGTNNNVRALTSYEPGGSGSGGSLLIAGGTFTMAGGVSANRIAQWDGTSWSALGSGFDRAVDALAVFDATDSPVLVAGGTFSTADAAPVYGIARWDGASWSPLSSGADVLQQYSTVHSLATYEAQAGPVLAVSGRLLIDATEFDLAEWNGTQWAPIPRSLTASYSDGPLAVYPSQSGPVLIAGDRLGYRIDAWRGATRSTVLENNSVSGGRIHALFAHDGDTGPTLVAGGDFEFIEDRASSRIAMFSCVSRPNLDIPDEIPAAADQPVTVPVVLNTDGAALASTSFSVDYDETCLAFDGVDGDNDGIPDAISFQGIGGYQLFVLFDPTDADGELDISVFDGPGASPLTDGTLVSIDFDVTCAPDSGAVREVPIRFSTDPEPTFGDPDAVDVDGTSSDGSVVIHGGLRGDCNASGALGSADLTAGELEIFDGDGAFWVDVPGGTFAGLPVGCDANADTTVDAGDLSCIHRLIFSETCAAPPTGPGRSPSVEPSRLELGPWEAPVADGQVVSVLRLTPGARAINSLALSLDLDTSRYAFDTTDADGDGLPDAIRLPGGLPSRVEVRWDPSDLGGELDLVIMSPGLDTSAAFGNLVEVEIAVGVLAPPSGSASGYVVQPFSFSTEPAPSLGDVYGQSVAPSVSVPRRGLFSDDFESGGTGQWSATQR